MCLSTVRRASDPEKIIMEYVSRVRIDGDHITLTDVMGEEKTVTGTLTFADLTGGLLTIDCRDE